MRFFVSARRHREELAAARAETARVRAQRDNALALRDTAEYNREQVLRQLAGQEAANARLHGRVLELGRRVSQLAESDPEHAARLERRVARLLKVGALLRALVLAERARADKVQKRLDDAVGLAPGGILSSAPWQPGYKAERDKQVAS